jgi:hypothetical protein
MALINPIDAALSAGQRIGRYFTQVSLIPTLLLVTWTYIVIASGAPAEKPAIRNVVTSFSHWSVGKVAGLLLATLAVALILHPLQFATTQLLEGYWGTTPLAATAMKIRIVHHRRRQRQLWYKATSSGKAWRGKCEELLKKDKNADQESQPLDERIEALVASKRGDPYMLDVIVEQEAMSQYENSYPDDPARMLPTRLGNALRRFEDAAGEQYGLKATLIAPHLHLVVPARHLEYLIDARQDMDAAIRTCTVGLLATALTAGLLVRDGVWLLWALVPYAISYLAYRGAVSAAQSYGVVFASVIDLDRFLLYKELGLFMPRDTDEERANNAELMSLLSGESGKIDYRRENVGTDSRASLLRHRPNPGNRSRN